MNIRVWVGCLAHYNNGDLIGEWVDGSEAPNWVCPERDPSNIYIACEETWIFDHEIPSARGEMDPMTAGVWAEAFAEVDDDQAGAFRAFMSWADEEDPHKMVARFHESYRGEWDSERDYAMHAFEELYGGIADEEIEVGYSGRKVKRVPEIFTEYFDWNHYAREMFQHYGYHFVGGHVFEDCG